MPNSAEPQNSSRQKLKSRQLLLSDLDPVRRRIAYLCDYFFAGDVAKFADAISYRPDKLRVVFYGRRGVTVRLVAQVARQLSIRLEWLLYGAGPPRETPNTNATPIFELPAALSSAYPTFDVLMTSHELLDLPLASTCPDTDPEQANLAAPHFSLAIAVHKARSAGAPVLLCLSDVAVHTGVCSALRAAFEKSYVTAVAVTGAAAVADMAAARQPRPDMNLLARLAAQQGIGYGEALARWGFAADTDREKSIICSAYDFAVPLSAHAEIGELADHLRATSRGAEIGAALGAASYVDFLVFAEQARKIMELGGVVVSVGPAGRFLSLLTQAFSAARTTVAAAAPFCLGVIDRAGSSYDTSALEEHCKCIHIVSGSCSNNVTNFFRACDAVYCGNIPNEFKK